MTLLLISRRRLFAFEILLGLANSDPSLVLTPQSFLLIAMPLLFTLLAFQGVKDVRGLNKEAVENGRPMKKEVFKNWSCMKN